MVEIEEEQPAPEKVKSLSDIVKVQVTIGTLGCEVGIYQKGEVFEITRDRAETFEKDKIAKIIEG